jgi:hypothetical protein
MLQNLIMGSLLVAFSVLVHTAGLITISIWTPRGARRFGLHDYDFGRTLVMMASVLGIFALHTTEIWIWAVVYTALGASENLADGLDLSTAMFATVGYGGVAFNSFWRLLTALEGINGFILIGWSTAYLVGVSTRHGPFRKSEHF